MLLDFTVPEKVNTHVFPHREIKRDCKRVVLKMCFHIYTHGAQKSRHSGCVSTKTYELACVSKMARERDHVSSSHHHPAW